MVVVRDEPPLKRCRVHFLADQVELGFEIHRPELGVIYRYLGAFPEDRLVQRPVPVRDRLVDRVVIVLAVNRVIEEVLSRLVKRHCVPAVRVGPYRAQDVIQRADELRPVLLEEHDVTGVLVPVLRRVDNPERVRHLDRVQLVGCCDITPCPVSQAGVIEHIDVPEHRVQELLVWQERITRTVLEPVPVLGSSEVREVRVDGPRAYECVHYASLFARLSSYGRQFLHVPGNLHPGSSPDLTASLMAIAWLTSFIDRSSLYLIVKFLTSWFHLLS
jgi:hypothetical protein